MTLYDGCATPMMEAVMLQGMRARFPTSQFETGEAPNRSLENSILPIFGLASTGDEGSWIKPVPDRFRSEVTVAFSDLLREARAARPS